MKWSMGRMSQPPPRVELTSAQKLDAVKLVQAGGSRKLAIVHLNSLLKIL